jgi:hypothetical protein
MLSAYGSDVSSRLTQRLARLHLEFDEARRTGATVNSLLNQARRQTIPAFRERGVWKIGLDGAPPEL